MRTAAIAAPQTLGTPFNVYRSDATGRVCPSSERHRG